MSQRDRHGLRLVRPDDPLPEPCSAALLCPVHGGSECFGSKEDEAVSWTAAEPVGALADASGRSLFAELAAVIERGLKADR